MPEFGVSSTKEKNLYNKMSKYKIYEKDIEEKFIHPSGKGGRKSDSTSNCVYLKHKPTGIEVKCQKNRLRALNRFAARKRLAVKIENLILGKKSQKQKEIAKARKAKYRRSKRAKEKMLKDKKKQSEKKQARTVNLYKELQE